MADTTLDVLVVGGGVTGCGIALDAAARGLSVGLVEARDLASGTSSRSSKLIHGGLRYLEQFQFSLVREALRERHRLLRDLAPHLVRPVPFVYPLTRRGVERPYVGAGLALYDALGGAGTLPRHRHLSHRALLEMVPGMRPDAAVGGIRYFDAQVDDARFTVTLARTAAARGAAIVTGARVSAIDRGPSGRVTGARVRDTVSGQDVAVRARHVIGAAGVWSERLQELAGAGTSGVRLRASKGIHVTVPRDAIDASAGLITRTDRSVLFVIPWRRHWLIGTTDTPWTHDLGHPSASRADVDYVLDQANRWLSRPLRRDDVVSAIAGLRPLVDASRTDTAAVSREHHVSSPAPGLTLVTGGKYTTYRIMAADAVDVAARDLGIDRPSTTDAAPLLGATGYPTRASSRALLATRWGVGSVVGAHLVTRYGMVGDEVAELIRRSPSLGVTLPDSGGYLAAEIVHAASTEAVLHLDDVLTRRTRIALETPDRGAAVAPEVARLVGEVLGWDERRRADEVAGYRSRLAAERLAEDAADDATADAARGSWRDPRLGSAAG